jgi:hypothetical protein
MTRKVLALAQALLICALMADSHSIAQTSTLPYGWATRDVGSPALVGSATHSLGVFTVKGAGTNICCAYDQFRYVYQPIAGDTQIVAFVASLQAVDTWSKAGVMIRAGLTGSSAHAFMFVSPAGTLMRSRLSPAIPSVDTAIAQVTAPYWVRLVREKNLLTAYRSQDGSHWTLVGTEVIAMPATAYVGLAVTSRSASVAATARFSNVTITKPSTGNKPPTVSISSPPTGASFVAPATIPITAIAGDVDGSIMRVAFYAGAQLVGSDTAYPFSRTWTNVPAGQYRLQALASDNSGATMTSYPITVTVVAAPVSTRPTKIVFVPPRDYLTNVTSVTAQLRRTADPTTAVPAATKNLGKPAVVSGEISADISTIVDPLPAGSYYAIVVSTGPGGSTPSSPSAPFTK